jgi:phospholipid/cholesterol/gamma-HCH transport system substrate-binding protein
VIFYFGCNFLKGLNVFNRKTHLYAVFENVGDLHESTNVVFNGFPIGKVNDITLLSTNPPRICAEILLTEDIDIPVDSRFEVAQKDVLGGMIVNLVMGSSKTFAKEKDTLGSMLAPGMFDGIDEIKAQLASVIASVDTLGLSLKSAFHPFDSANSAIMLKATFVNLEASTRHLNQLLANNEGKVGRLVSQLEQLSATLSDATPQINTIIANLDNISDSLAQSNIRTLVDDAQSTLANLSAVTAKIENGEGTAGKLINNEQLYQNVTQTLESLNVLIKDLKANPSKYINVTVFGKKEKKDKKDKKNSSAEKE